MLGQIELTQFKGLTAMPQEAVSAWAAVNAMTGVALKPLLFVGTQQSNGINYWFVAEETFITLGGGRRLILVAVNNHDGQYSFVGDSIETIVP